MLGFQQRLKELREERGFTQSDLAKRLNVARSNISKYETGFLDANTEVLMNIAEIFNCTVNYLLGVDDNREGEVNKLTEELKDYKTAVIMAKESGITPEDLKEHILLLRKMANKKD